MKKLDDLKIGIVFVGGGTKGAYQGGVLKALWELGFIHDVKVVSSVSIGTLNALMMCMKDKELIDLSWKSLSYSKIMTRDGGMKVREIGDFIRRYTLQRNKDKDLLEQFDLNELGLISQTGIRQYIKEFVDVKVLHQKNIDVYSCAYNIEEGAPEYFKLNDYNEEEIIDITIGSCAVPFVFKPVHFQGKPYADGGFNSSWYPEQNADNVPIKPLLEYDCDLIIVIHLCHKERVNHKHYDKKNIIEIYPSASIETVKGSGTFNFYHGSIQQRLTLGYRDGMVALAPLAIAHLKGDALTPYLKRHQERNQELVWKKHKKVEK